MSEIKRGSTFNNRKSKREVKPVSERVGHRVKVLLGEMVLWPEDNAEDAALFEYLTLSPRVQHRSRVIRQALMQEPWIIRRVALIRHGKLPAIDATRVDMP